MVISLNIDAISRWVRMPADSFSSIRPFAPPLIQYWLDNPLVMGIWPDLHKVNSGQFVREAALCPYSKGRHLCILSTVSLSVILFFRPFRYLEKPYEPYFFGLNFALFSYVTAE